MRPMDVVATRKGTSIEIGHTDAEGRVVLADALAEASSESPELLVDFATLTGAARVALGPDLPALFCNDDALAAELSRQGERRGDPVWRMPLHAPYRRLIDGKTADITNAAETPYAGAITAALFLAEFVDNTIPWAHFDLMAWNLNDRPGAPRGRRGDGPAGGFGRNRGPVRRRGVDRRALKTVATQACRRYGSGFVTKASPTDGSTDRHAGDWTFGVARRSRGFARNRPTCRRAKWPWS